LIRYQPCKAPKKCKSKWFPLIIENDLEAEKKDPPLLIVIVSFPALIKSCSTSSSKGYLPTPYIS